MTLTLLTRARILTPEGYIDGHSVLIENGEICDICPDDASPARPCETVDLHQQRLLPGFIDLQVNGGGGVLFNDVPTVDGIRAIGRAHRQFGTTGFLPTLISDDKAVMARALAAVNAAMAANVPGVLGVHFEGPFLNSAKRGVHNASTFGVIDDDAIALMCGLSKGVTLVTLAPELTTPKVIKTLVSRGVVVSAGHSLADYDQAKSAFDAGLSGVTHLFNAMPMLASRAPGLIAAALEDPRVWCGIIADGYHVHPAMLRLAHRAKTDRQIFLVTDAMPNVGTPQDSFLLQGQDVRVQDGQCLTAEGTLAGSALTMNQAVINAEVMMGLSQEEAVFMASAKPAAFIGQSKKRGAIKVGLKADLVCLNEKGEVTQSWIAGVPNPD